MSPTDMGRLKSGMRVRPSRIGCAVYGAGIGTGTVTGVWGGTVTVRHDADGVTRVHGGNIWEPADHEQPTPLAGFQVFVDPTVPPDTIRLHHASKSGGATQLVETWHLPGDGAAQGRHVIAVDQGSGQSVGVVAISTTLSMRVDPEPWHRMNTAELGARHGERLVNYAYHREHSPVRLAAESAAWSAHLRFLVERSQARARAAAPTVGWDPYGEDMP